MTDKKLKKLADPLLEIVCQIQNKDDAFDFLRDLLTENEIVEFLQRLDIAKRLMAGESYVSIEKNTGVSSTTIARVAKFTKWKYGGYRKFL